MSSSAAGFDAFISYSHAADGRLAPALQAALGALAKPWYRRRALRVFRDRTSLSASPQLWPAIEGALSRSRYFVLLASTEAAASHWIDQEVRWWRTQRSHETLLIALTGGELDWDEASGDFTAGSAIPAALRGWFPAEPLWVDLRWARGERDLSMRNPRFREAVADLAAPLRGLPKDELIGEDIDQHRRTVRLVRASVAVLLVLLVAALAGAAIALVQRNRAEEERTLALSRELAAQSVAQQSSDPQLALLLGIEAVRQDSNLETEAALREGLAGNHLRAVLRVSEQPLAGVEFSPDGKAVLAAGDDGRAWLIDASSGATIATLRAGPPGRTHAAFARGGSLVLTTNVHRGSRLWDAASGHLLRQLPDRGRRVWNGAISPTGDLIAAAVSNRVYLWTRGGKPRGVVRVRNQVEDVAFSPDGELLAIGDVWGIVRIRRLGPGTTSPKLGEGLGRVTSLGFGPDGRAVLAAGEGKVQALAIAGGEAQTLVEGSSSSTLYPPEPNAVDASADGLLAVGYGDGTLTATDFRPLDRGFTTQSGGGAVTDLDFSPDGHSIVTAQADGSVRLFAVSSMQRSVTSLGPPGGIQSIALSPDGRFLAATFPPEVMELVDLPARLLGTSVWRLSDRRPWKVSANPGDLRADFSPDGRLLAIAGVRRTAVWPLFARRPAWRLPTSSVDVAFSPDSTLLAIAGRRGAVTVRRAGDGRLVETVPKEGRSWARRVSFSPDGSALLAVGSDGVVRLWDRDERTVMRSFGGRGDAFVEAVLSADGERVAAISAARLAVIDLDSGETARTAPIGSQDLRSVAFSSDSRSVVVAGEDGRATVLSVDGLHPVTDFVLSGESLSAAAFGPDPTLVALGGDGGVKVFRCDLCLPPSRLLTLAEATAIRGLSPAERRRYLG